MPKKGTKCAGPMTTARLIQPQHRTLAKAAAATRPEYAYPACGAMMPQFRERSCTATAERRSQRFALASPPIGDRMSPQPPATVAEGCARFEIMARISVTPGRTEVLPSDTLDEFYRSNLSVWKAFRPPLACGSTTAGSSATSARATASSTRASVASALCAGGRTTRSSSPPMADPRGSASIRSRRSRSTISCRGRRCCPSARRAATWPASSARTGTSPKRARLDRLRTRPRRKTSYGAAIATGSRSVAYTYNDPVIFLEYAVDVAEAARERGIKNVAVTAGYIAPRRARRALHVDGRRQRRPQGVHRGVLQAAVQRPPRRRAGDARVPQARDDGLARDHDAADPRPQRQPGGGDRARRVGDGEARARTCRCTSRPSTPTTRCWTSRRRRRARSTMAREIAREAGSASSTPATSTTRRARAPIARAAARRVIGRDWYEITSMAARRDGRCGACDTTIPGCSKKTRAPGGSDGCRSRSADRQREAPIPRQRMCNGTSRGC